MFSSSRQTRLVPVRALPLERKRFNYFHFVTNEITLERNAFEEEGIRKIVTNRPMTAYGRYYVNANIISLIFNRTYFGIAYV